MKNQMKNQVSWLGQLTRCGFWSGGSEPGEPDPRQNPQSGFEVPLSCWHRSLAQVGGTGGTGSWHRWLAQVAGTGRWHRSLAQVAGTGWWHRSLGQVGGTGRWLKAVMTRCGFWSMARSRILHSGHAHTSFCLGLFQSSAVDQNPQTSNAN